MELADWTIEFVKARYAIHRTMQEYMQEGDEITFIHKHKVHHFLVSPVLVVPEPRDHYTIVCLNTEQNLAFLAQHWNEFLKPNLSVIFANPEMNVSWQVNPKVHALIADEDTLEQGLRAMAAETPLV